MCPAIALWNVSSNSVSEKGNQSQSILEGCSEFSTGNQHNQVQNEPRTQYPDCMETSQLYQDASL